MTRRGAAAVVTISLLLALLVGVIDAGPSAGDEGDETTTTTSTSTSTTTTTIAAGGSTTSHGSSATPSALRPVIARVTTPVEGPVTFDALEELPIVDGFDSIAAMTITAPTTTSSGPLRITFGVDVSDVDSDTSIASLVPLLNGVAVPSCVSTVAANPDPCLVSRTVDDDVLTLGVLTSSTGTWTMARTVVERVAPSTTDAASTGAFAIAASRRMFTPGSANAVVLARVDDFADALAGAPLAAARAASLLLTSTSELDDTTLDEITRILPTGRNVYVLGGPAAISTAVVQRLRSWGYVVVRYAGADRYATAAAIATIGLDSPSTVVETTGLNFADALAAGSIASHVSGAVLLTNGATMPPATASYLAAHHPIRYAIGGPSKLADPAATAFAGVDRIETAVLAARHFYSSPKQLTLASAFTYTDAVTAAAYAAIDDTPLLLLPASGDLPVPVAIYLREIAHLRPAAALFGSTTSVTAALETVMTSAIGA
jgi:putative cell wall-binding protein